jgi:hypothetical protein
MYTVFVLCSPTYTLSPSPPLPTGSITPDRIFSVLLFSDFVEEKKKEEKRIKEKHDIFASLR